MEQTNILKLTHYILINGKINFKQVAGFDDEITDGDKDLPDKQQPLHKHQRRHLLTWMP